MTLEVIVGIFVDWIVLMMLPCSLLLRFLLRLLFGLRSLRSSGSLALALSLSGRVVNSFQAIHLKPAEVDVFTVVLVIVELIVVVTIGRLVFVEVVLIPEVFVVLRQRVVIELGIVISILLRVLMALFRIVEVFLSVDVSLGMWAGCRVVLPMLLVSAISGLGKVREGMLGMGTSAVRGRVMLLSIVRGWIVLLVVPIMYRMVLLAVRSDVTVVLHQVSLSTGVGQVDRMGRRMSSRMGWLVMWASPVTMGRPHSSGSVDWMMLSSMAVHVSAISVLRLVASSSWCARCPRPSHLGSRCSATRGWTLRGGLGWRAHHWPCSWRSEILRGRWRRWCRCWKRWLSLVRWLLGWLLGWLLRRLLMASWLGWSWTRLGPLLVPIVWQVEMHIDISAIEIVVSAQGESYILSHLPAHVIYLIIRLLISV